PSRRRRRDGPLAARRPGVRGRRVAAGRRADPAHAARRPGDGDRAPRRRRLPGGAGRGRSPRRPDPDALMTTLCIRGAGQIPRPAREGLPYQRRPEYTSEPGSITVRDGVIESFDDSDADVVIDAAGGAVIPGFVDCHTHLPFAGWRANEYEMKVTGVP